MISARIRAELPEEMWVADVSRRMPDTTFRLLSGVRADETAVELGEATGDDLSATGDAIAAHESIIEYEPLEVTDERALAKYETTDTLLYELVAASSIPVEYPVVVRDGWYELDITGTREEFERFQAVLDTSGRRYQLLSLLHESDTAGLLTDRQREVLEAGLREGYFEIPRDCTLAELAESVDADKSTVSRLLRRGEAQIIRHHLTTVRS